LAGANYGAPTGDGVSFWESLGERADAIHGVPTEIDVAICGTSSAPDGAPSPKGEGKRKINPKTQTLCA